MCQCYTHRWSKGGPVACSIENRRLFASFHSGSIACILDPNGSGSVMDSRGRCLLLINDQHKAKVLNKQGNVVVEYDMNAVYASSALETNGMRTNATNAAKEEEDMSLGTQNDEESSHGNNKTGQQQSPVKPTEKLHRWKSDGMQIDFIPKQWEVLQTEQCSSSISSSSSSSSCCCCCCCCCCCSIYLSLFVSL